MNDRRLKALGWALLRAADSRCPGTHAVRGHSAVPVLDLVAEVGCSPGDARDALDVIRSQRVDVGLSEPIEAATIDCCVSQP